MWDLAVVVVQLACVVMLVAGAILSIWFARDEGPSENPVESQPVVTAEAAVKTVRKLKRAA